MQQVRHCYHYIVNWQIDERLKLHNWPQRWKRGFNNGFNGYNCCWHYSMYRSHTVIANISNLHNHLNKPHQPSFSLLVPLNCQCLGTALGLRTKPFQNLNLSLLINSHVLDTCLVAALNFHQASGNCYLIFFCEIWFILLNPLLHQSLCDRAYRQKMLGNSKRRTFVQSWLTGCWSWPYI